MGLSQFTVNGLAHDIQEPCLVTGVVRAGKLPRVRSGALKIIDHRLALVGLALFACACPPAATLPRGCGKDTDCKGARVCIASACVEPAPKPVAVDAARAKPEEKKLPAPTTDGGVAVAPDGGGEVGDGGVAVVLPPVGQSQMFHVDAAHSGRSRFRAPAHTPREVAHVATGGVVYASPAITDDGVLIFGSHDRAIYGAGADGEIKWRHASGDLVWASPALAAGGVAYVGSDDDRLYALDTRDGSVRWQFTAGPCRVSVGSGPEAARCDVDAVTVAPDGTVLVSADGLYALRPDGTLKWKFSPGATHCASAAAVGPDGLIYVGCQDDALYALDAGGVKKWEFRATDDVDSSPAVAPDGTVYVGSDDHKLYALGPGGALKFAITTGGAVRSSPALAADGTVYVGSFDGALYAVKPTGQVAWSYRTADRILSSPLVDAAGTILIGSEDDRLYALAPDGKLLWSVLFDGDVTIYVGADDRALHALR